MYVNTFTFHGLNVAANTNWTFVRIELGDGSVGWGECSLNGWEQLQAAYVDVFRAQLVGKHFHSARDAARLCQTYLHSPGGLVAHSVKSAAEQALLDAAARANGLSVATYLTQELSVPIFRGSVAVYANINRATTPRTPLNFAAYGKKASTLGFASVKLAPFDGVLPTNCDTAEGSALIDAGIARVYAVRDAVGDGLGVKVDCHWRFTPAVASSVLARLRDAKLDWFECPISEQAAYHDDIRALRHEANAINVALAGGEMLTSVDGFRPLLEHGLYDTIMPDVKYCGGLVALHEIGVLAAKHSVQVAPHNPTGPICNFASLHACAIGERSDLLEYQLGESDLFRQMVFNAHPTLRNGAFVVPTEAGLGATVDEFTLSQHPLRAVGEGLDPSLG
jgi:galactonate dehydratase